MCLRSKAPRSKKMTNALKVTANRANAQVSTGPKTRRGKARSARNALRHGLGLPIAADPNLAKEVRALAVEIAGSKPTFDVLQYALLVAEAQVDLNRLRRARHQEKIPTEIGRRQSRCLRVTATSSSHGSPATALTLTTDLFGQLLKIDHYERRRLSRRKFAIRKFDRARQRHLRLKVET